MVIGGDSGSRDREFEAQLRVLEEETVKVWQKRPAVQASALKELVIGSTPVANLIKPLRL